MQRYEAVCVCVFSGAAGEEVQWGFGLVTYCFDGSKGVVELDIWSLTETQERQFNSLEANVRAELTNILLALLYINKRGKKNIKHKCQDTRKSESHI